MEDPPTLEEVKGRIEAMKAKEWRRGYNSGMRDAINALRQGLTIEEIEKGIED